MSNGFQHPGLTNTKAKRTPKKISWSVIGYLAVAFVCALTLWFYVADYDTIAEKTFSNIPVELLRPTKEDITVESGEGKLVNVTVRGRKADLKAVKDNDIRAYIDVRNAVQDGEINAEVMVELPDGITLVDNNALSITHVVVGLSIPTVKELPLEIIYSAGLDDGHDLESQCRFNKINVIGSSSVIEPITGARVKLDVGNIQESRGFYGQKIELVDAQGFTLSLPYVKISDPEGKIIPNGLVDVYVRLMVEKELPVTVEFVGGVFNSTDATVKCDPEIVTVRGSAEKLNKMESVAIPVDEKTIDNIYNGTLKLPELGESVQYMVDDDNVDVKITLKDIQSYTMTVSVDNIKAINLPEGLSADFSFTKDENGNSPRTVSFVVRGYKDAISMLRRNPMEKVSLTVDFTGFASTNEGIKLGDTFSELGVDIHFADLQGVFTTDKLTVSAVIVEDTP